MTSTDQIKAAGFTTEDCKMCFFVLVDEKERMFKCKLCDHNYSAKHGNTNLCNHVIVQHTSWKEDIATFKKSCA
jgi:hypothetical protein